MQYNNILIVKLSAIGDVIHALPVAHALKQCRPQSRITWVVERPAYDIVHSNPYIDEIIIFDKPKCKSFSGLIDYAPDFVRQLKNRKFDLALDLQGLFKSSIIALFSGAKKRYVYCNSREMSDWVSEKVCGPNQAGHIVEQYLDVVRQLGCATGRPDFAIRLDNDERTLARSACMAAGLDPDKPYVVFAPGANWPNKRWPTAAFAELARLIIADGLIPVITGGPGDRGLAEDITKRIDKPVIDLTGKTNLKQLAWVINQAKLLVGGDTGPMHLAAALGRPVVALLGPTDANRNGPYGPGHQILSVPYSCAGCWRRRCPENRDCLEAVSAESVFHAVQQLLDRSSKSD